MTDLKETREAPLSQLWRVLESVHAVMLGSPNPEEHMQPMAPQPAADEQAIWFFTRMDTDLAMAAEAGGTVHMCVFGPGGDYYACLKGKLTQQRSQPHIDRFWSPVAAAWFHDKSDPSLTMLRFRPFEAAIWASRGSGARFGWEILKANVTDDEPNLGVTTKVKFPIEAIPGEVPS